jgi:putative hydrolase of the HAD superfamily
MITTVVFDLDDTLYDEIEYCKSGFAAVAEYLAGRPKMPSADRIFTALWSQFRTGNHTETINGALDELELPYDEDLIRELVEIYRRHVPQIRLPDDSVEVLCELKAKYTLALLTDGYLPGQQFKVQSLAIEKYIKTIVYTEQLGREYWKPSPAGFEKLIEILDERPKNMVYVADNGKKDFIAPNKLGFMTVQLIRPARLHTSGSEESDAAAQHVIRQIGQLPPLLQAF